MTSGSDPHLSDGFRKAGKLVAAGDLVGADKAAVALGEELAAGTPTPENVRDFDPRAGYRQLIDAILGAGGTPDEEPTVHE